MSVIEEIRADGNDTPGRDKAERYVNAGGGLMDPGWIIRLDPPAVRPDRTQLDLNVDAIRVGSIDWGQAAITAYEAQAGKFGTSKIDEDYPNRTVTINMLLGADDGIGGVSQEQARALLQQKIARIQDENGVIMRKRQDGPASYLDIQGATLVIPDVFGETGGIEPNVVLTLDCLPDFYVDEVTLDAITATGVSHTVLTDGVANYVPNGGFAHDTPGGAPAGWLTSDGLLVLTGSTLNVQASGGPIASDPNLQITTTTTAQGCEIELPVLPVGSWTLSFWAKTTTPATLAVLVGPHSDDAVTTTRAVTTTWTRFTFDFEQTDATIRFYVMFAGIHGTWQLANVMVNADGGAYVDGDTPGFAWAGTPGNSATLHQAVIQGDYPARCRIQVTDLSDVDQLGALWAFRSRTYDPAATAGPFLEAEALTPLNDATAVTDSNASGGHCVEFTPSIPAGVWTSMLATDLTGGAQLTHQGSYAVWARVRGDGNSCQFRMLWGTGDASHYQANDPVGPLPTGSGYYLVNLGTIRVDAPLRGTPRWRGIIQAFAPETMVPAVDYLLLQSLDDASGQLFAVQQTNQQTASLTAAGYAGAASTTGTGGLGATAWANPTNAEGPPDGAGAGVPTHATAGVLTLTGFGFAIPSGATISGIAVTASVTSTGGVVDETIQLVKAGSAVGSNRSAGGIWPVGASTRVYGSGSDLWGTTWTPAQINASNFGVDLQALAQIVGSPPRQGQGLVDSVLITVSYFLGTGFVEPTDAVIKADQQAEFRTDGMIRTDAAGAWSVDLGGVLGDLPRLPPSGLEGRPVELMLLASRGVLGTDKDSAVGDQRTIQVIYHPCFLSRP